MNQNKMADSDTADSGQRIDYFLADLDRRANPERSRRFSNSEFEAGLNRLTRLLYVSRQMLSIDFQPKLRISIVGTNGKGSVAFALESLFRQSQTLFEKPTVSTRQTSDVPVLPSQTLPSPVTGLFTSPHLVSFTERIRLNRLPVSVADLTCVYDRIAKLPFSATEQTTFASLTYFELLTLLAVILFDERQIDIQIFEAGLGGRLDATRITDPTVVVVTSIGLDHTSLLGHTRRQIFQEKIAIAGDKTSAVFIEDANFLRYVAANLQPTSVVFHETSANNHSNYITYNQNYARFIFENLTKRFSVPVSQNTKDIVIEPAPGRFERRIVDGRQFIFDNGHNANAVFTFLSQLSKSVDLLQTIVVAGIAVDRPVHSILRILNRFQCKKLLLCKGSGLQTIDEATAAKWLTDIDYELMNQREIQDNLRNETTLSANVVFLGSHRLYELFDTLTQLQTTDTNEQSAEKSSSF